MYNLSKMIRMNFVVSKTHCFKLYPYNALKLGLSIHTSIQKSTDASNSQKTSILVYEAPLKRRVKFVKLFSLSSTMFGVAVFPHAITDLWKVNVLMGCAAGVISAFFFSTPLMLHWITKRYVLDLHFEKETKVFTAETFNIICQIQEIKFQANDVIVPDLPGMLSSFLVKGRPLFVDANLVQDPDAYSHMMGYDKPFDFTLKPDEEKEDNKTS